MSATRRFRVIVGLFCFATAALLGWQVASGKNPIMIKEDTAPKEKDEPRTDEFTFKIDEKRAPKIIEAVTKHLKAELPAEEWKDIITNLQALLDDKRDQLVEWTDPLSKDRKPKKESIRIAANKLIGRFSKQGRDFYQREMGPIADQKLKEAGEQGNLRLLAEVSAILPYESGR